MSQQIVFYYNPMSRARIVHWILEEIGVPYEVRLLNFETGEHKQPGYLAVNPMGKVPALVHNGTVITEAAAICTYLADIFPEAGLAPAVSDHPARGTYLRWLFFGAGCVEPAFVDKLFSRPTPERPSALGYGSYPDVLNALEQAITPGPFILGDRFSAADVYVGSQIVWGMLVKALEPRPIFEAYAKRLSERPAYQRSVSQGEKYISQLRK